MHLHHCLPSSQYPRSANANKCNSDCSTVADKLNHAQTVCQSLRTLCWSMFLQHGLQHSFQQDRSCTSSHRAIFVDTPVLANSLRALPISSPTALWLGDIGGGMPRGLTPDCQHASTSTHRKQDEGSTTNSMFASGDCAHYMSATLESVDQK